MKKSIAYLSALLLTVSLTSCGQSLPKDAHEVAAAYCKDKVPVDLSRYSQATFAAGCFWHEETLFESIKGVMWVVSGYAGGTTANPTYEDIETGNTGHAETVNIYYDSNKISFPALLHVYFESQEDPTQVNGQGPDEGTQYRSIVFYRNATEKTEAEQEIARINKSGKYTRPIAAEVSLFSKFWPAEDYHQHYITVNNGSNMDNPYVTGVSLRDIARYQSAHPDIIKPGHSFAK